MRVYQISLVKGTISLRLCHRNQKHVWASVIGYAFS